MVWIHGGAWYLGSGNGVTDQYGPERFMDRDIVLVTLNYRLGNLNLNALSILPQFNPKSIPIKLAALQTVVYC